MQQEEQYIIVSGRSVKISKNLQNVVQENDNLSEKVLITMDRFYDGADFDSKNINMYIKTPVNNELIINLNSVKTTSADMISFDFVFTRDMTVDRGWLDIVFIVTDQSGFKWSSQQANKAIFVGSNFTTHKQPVPNEYYVDLEEYRKEILGYVNDAKNSVNASRLEADRAKTEADRAWGADFSKHVTIDSVAKTNFDFIEGKVVQDGLASSILNQNLELEPKKINYKFNGAYTIQITYRNVSSSVYLCLFQGYSLFIDTQATNLRIGVNGTYVVDTGIPKNLKKYEISVVGNKIGTTLCINGKTFSVSRILDGNAELWYSPVSDGNKSSGHCDFLVYNRQLTPQEIQHNFSVLNNSPSINQLKTTDSTGKTSTLALSSDEDHVEMSTGRTLRQEYMGLLKRDGKEFTSDGTGKIEVNNGLEARMISSEIKGQTVKNYANIDTSTVRTLGDLWNGHLSFGTPSLQQGKQFILMLNIVENNNDSETPIRGWINSGDTGSSLTPDKIPAKFTGVFQVTGNFGANTKSIFIARSGANTIKYKEVCLVELGDEKKTTGIIPFGLSSTQAIISNNGMKYPFCHPTELNEDGSRKVILLGGIGDVADTLELKDDGSGGWNISLKDYNLSQNGIGWSCEYGVRPSQNNMAIVYCNLRGLEGFKKGTSGDCSLFSVKTTNAWSNATSESIYTDGANDVLRIVINGGSGNRYGIVSSDTNHTISEKFKNWVVTQECILKYQLNTPIVTVIPKELMPVIQTEKINILSVDSAVKPSSFKAIVPVDKITSLETRLSQLEAIVNAPKNMKIQANYVDDEYNKSIKQLEGMM